MPLFHMFTNLPESALKDGVEARIAEVLASTLSKPLESVTVLIVPGVRIFRYKSTEPACAINLSSVQVFSKEKNADYNNAFMEVVTTELGIPRDRVCMTYTDIDRAFIAK